MAICRPRGQQARAAVPLSKSYQIMGRNEELSDTQVTFQTGQGMSVRGTVVRLTRHTATFEVYDPAVVLQTSEALRDFQILVADRAVYSGRAVVSGFVPTGPLALCDARLQDEPQIWDEPSDLLVSGAELHASYDRFVTQRQNLYRIGPEFKVVVADVEAFLSAVAQWFSQIESNALSGRGGQLGERGKELVESVGPRIIATFNSRHEQFEELACRIPPELLEIHEDFVRQHWHRLFLGCPFGERTFYKPLGYAGDYEMMNMIHRNQPEGNSLFTKLIHFLLVSQWPAKSVRNRIAHLKQVIFEECLRVERLNRPCRVLNVGCGPAREIQRFFTECPPAGIQEFTLLDFNEETLQYASTELTELKRRFAHRAHIAVRHVSVYQLLRHGAVLGAASLEGPYDFIYCAGLFDYLADETCRSLVQLLYNSLQPEGVVVVANMKDDRPFRYFIEFVLDWRLIYRDGTKMRSFAPKQAIESARLIAEDTAVNLFLHLRKQA